MMPWFCCALRGDDFPLTLTDEPGRYGFYTTRWVEAPDAAKAELKAVALIRADERFAGMPRIYTPMVYLEEIIELARKPKEAPGKGYTFYPMKDGET